jgi:hypothetical protein
MPFEKRSIEEPSMEDLNDDIVEPMGGQGYGKKSLRAKGGEKGAEDLEPLMPALVRGRRADFIRQCLDGTGASHFLFSSVIEGADVYIFLGKVTKVTKLTRSGDQSQHDGQQDRNLA